MIKVPKPATILDLGPVDANAIMDRLSMLSDTAWEAEDAAKENKYRCFQNTKHIIHRFIPKNRDPLMSYDTRAWFIWKDLLMPIMDHVTRQYGYRERAYPKSMFARLAAGKVIEPHCDGAGSHLLTHKIHIPLATTPDATFQVAGETFHLPAGHAFEVNNIVEHGAFNRGQTDRIHFIFEMYDASQLSSQAA